MVPPEPYIIFILLEGRLGALKKKILTVSVAVTIGLSSLSWNTALASSKLDSLQSQKSEIQSKKSEINSQIDGKSEAINQVKVEQETVNKEIKRIDLAVGDTEVKIVEKQKEISETQEKIRQLQEEIKVLKERIEKRNAVLQERARSMQENGKVTYLDVLLGAQSFGDFIDRVGAVATIMEADKTILEEHQADKEALEKTQAEVEKSLASLERMLADLESLKKTLSAQKVEKEKIMASLKQEEAAMEEAKLELEEEQALLASQERAMQKAIELEKKRIASEQARKRSSNSGGSASSAPPVSSGSFTKPAAGYVSSDFGMRSLGNHKGVDIAKSGTVPVVAAADGVVIRSYYSSSYGNAIFISHSIDGQIYTTVYAHLNSRQVSEGQVVSKGQQIGYMGNTGRSYGQHLHFELHRGPWNASKSNAINPAGIVPL